MQICENIAYTKDTTTLEGIWEKSLRIGFFFFYKKFNSVLFIVHF